MCLSDKKELSFRAKNFNKMEIRISDIIHKWPQGLPFTTEGQRGNYLLAASEEHAYKIEYRPQRAGEHKDSLSVNVILKILGTTLSEDRKVPVKGRGLECEKDSRKYPKLSFSPNPVDFDDVCVGDAKTLTLMATNDGDYELLKWKYLLPLNPFSVSPLPNVPRVSVGEGRKYSVTFTARPGREENRFGVITQFVNKFGEELSRTFEVKLHGRGIDCSPKEEEAVIAPEPKETPVPKTPPPTANKCEAVCGAGRVKTASTLAACSDISQEFLCIQSKKACFNYLVPVGWQNDSGCCCVDAHIETSAASRINCSDFVGWDANGFAVTKNPKYPRNTSTLPPTECK